MGNSSDFLSLPSNLAAVHRAVLDIQSDLAPEEVEVTESYVSPLIELAAQEKLPSASSSDEPGAFGAADWMLPSIVLLVMRMLQARLTAGTAQEAWATITEAEVRSWVRRSGSRRDRKLIPELTRSLQRAFRKHLVAGPTEKARAREERYTDISCPRQVWTGTARFSLVVRLTLRPVPWSAAEGSLDVEAGKTVHVHLQAPTAFEILTASWQEITIPPGQDSTPAVFDLRPKQIGPQSIGLDFYQDGHHLGTIKVPVDVVDQPIPEVQTQAHASVLPAAPEVAPPDRVLRIAWDPDSSSLMLTLLQGGGTLWWSAPSWRIHREPSQWAEELFKELNSLTERPHPSSRDLLGNRGFLPAPDVEESLKRLGQNLWRELPEDLRSLYGRQRDRWRDSSLLILSDEPYLPWELLWPYGEGWDDPEPWCLSLRLSRWLAQGARGEGNSGAPGVLPLTALACLSPRDQHLPAAEQERSSLQRLLARRGVRDVSPPEPTWEAVMELLRAGPYDWLHAITHGSVSSELPDQRSALWLQGQQALTPQHFVGAKIEDGLRKNRPAFVFNVCHAGRLGWGLTGLGGWADRLISCGAGLFLGPLWKVADETASQMAQSFYEHLLDGETTVAEAVRFARRNARNSGNPTWLAYSLYAHPNATVQLPLGAPLLAAGHLAAG